MPTLAGGAVAERRVPPRDTATAHTSMATAAQAGALPAAAATWAVGRPPPPNIQAEESLLGVIAKRVGRPLRWRETRSESMMSLGHGCAQAISKEHPDRPLPTIDHAQDRPEPSVLIESLPGKPGVEVLVRLELGKQTIDVVDVLGAFDLRDHDHVEGLTGFEDGGGQVVEAPRRVEAVDPGPELRVAEIDRVGDLDEAGSCRFLLIGGHAVFEVREQDVNGGRDVGHLRAHLLVGGREEVDHPAGRERDLAHGFGGPDGERTEEISGWTHDATVDLATDTHQSTAITSRV